MANNLLHSISHFSPIIEEILREADPKSIVEVGSEFAGSTVILAKFAQNSGAKLTVIDPNPRVELHKILAPYGDLITICADRSVNALTHAYGDVYFLDGDHNYWTVSRELELISSSNPRPWIVLHDVGEPCARRDFYYSPDTIPAEHLLPYSFTHSVDLRTGRLTTGAGFNGKGDMAIALERDTPKNGVLTAVEDFLSSRPELEYFSIPSIFGLGVITPAEDSPRIRRILSPYDSTLMHDLEKNRLEMYNDLLVFQHRLRGTFTRRWVNRILDALGL